MFSEKKTPKSSFEINKISQNTNLVGDIISESDFRIDGAIEGTITTPKRIIIGKQGQVKGNITCNDAEIEGNFSGNLTVKNLLTLKASAKITGDVIIGKLHVEPGASFNASCNMKGEVKELKNAQQKEQSEKTA